jgi:pimeloyl-ACP methyl ester carboxylesterase
MPVDHHGMTGASSQVPEYARSLCEQSGIRVVLLDSRGCGKTLCDHPTIATQYTQAQMATDLIAVANALGVKRFAVGGQSYGTRVSLFTAAMAKGRVDKIVLVVPPPITSLWGSDGASLTACAQQHHQAVAQLSAVQSKTLRLSVYFYFRQ